MNAAWKTMLPAVCVLRPVLRPMLRPVLLPSLRHMLRTGSCGKYAEGAGPSKQTAALRQQRSDRMDFYAILRAPGFILPCCTQVKLLETCCGLRQTDKVWDGLESFRYIQNSSVWFRFQSRSSSGLVVKTLVAKSRGRGFESHGEQKVNFSNLFIFKN